MKYKMHIRILLLAGLLVGSSMAYADDDLDVTMRMVPAGVDLPDAVTKVISLPAQSNGIGNSKAQSDAARDMAPGQSVQGPPVELPQVTLPEQAKGRGPH
jgi:hypothetical protein